MIGKKVKFKESNKPKHRMVGDLVDYVRFPHNSNPSEKVEYAGYRNFISTTHKGQKAEMITLAQEATRSKMPVSHYVFSWKAGEQPTRQQVDELVDIFLEGMELQGHQTIYGLHKNTDYLHVHIAVNRMNEQTGKVVLPHNGWDIEALHKITAIVNHKQKWEAAPNARYVVLEDGTVAKRSTAAKATSRQLGDRAAMHEQRTGEKSAQTLAKEKALPVIVAATSWSELHKCLSDIGMRFEKKGSGAVIHVGQTVVKASSIDRSISLSKLSKRLGVYEPGDYGEAVSVPSEPLEDVAALDLVVEWQTYQSEQEQADTTSVNNGQEEGKTDTSPAHEWAKELARQRSRRRTEHSRKLAALKKYGRHILNIARYCLKHKPPANDWPEGLRKITTLTSVSKMKSHADYVAAKAGDTDAAFRLVCDLLAPDAQQKKIRTLGQQYPDAVVVAVHAEEAGGRNKIPVQLGRYIAATAGLYIDGNITQATRAHRTDQSAAYRMLSRPAFTGRVKPGQEYIIVDDVVTQGGTISELRNYIESQGGVVVSAMTAAAALGGTVLAVTPENVLALEEKFGVKPLHQFLKELDLYGGNHKALTNSEALYLLKFKSLDAARNSRLAPGSSEFDSPRQRVGSQSGASSSQGLLTPLAQVSPTLPRGSPQPARGNGSASPRETDSPQALKKAVSDLTPKRTPRYNRKKTRHGLCFEDWLRSRGRMAQAQLWRMRSKCSTQYKSEEVQSVQTQSVPLSEEMLQFNKYANAVGADRYRVTSIRLLGNGMKQAFVLDKQNGESRGFTPAGIALHMQELIRLGQRGENIYYTPISDDRHHILIDDMSEEALTRFQRDGFEPAVILESSPGNYQCILTIPKLKSGHDREVANRLTRELNQKYGDPKLSGGVHPHRAPGFENRKPKHRRSDGTFPKVALHYAEKRQCRKALDMSIDINKEYVALQGKQRPFRLNHSLSSLGSSTNTTAAYYAHFEDLKAHLAVEDYSRVDAMIAVRLRATGHDGESIAAAIEQCAPTIREKPQSRNWHDYAKRTVNYAYGPAGEAVMHQYERQIAHWRKVEGQEEERPKAMRMR